MVFLGVDLWPVGVLQQNQRYRLTPFGLKTALFYSRAYQRLLRRGLSDLHDPRLSESSALALNFAHFQKVLAAYVTEKIAA